MVLIILFIAFIIIWCLSPLFRIIVRNLYIIPVYALLDFIYNIKHRKECFPFPTGISIFVGMFGTGKTLSMTHRALNLYKACNGKIRIISNYHINDIPYIPLVNFNQICELENDPESEIYGTLVLIDEVEHLLSHRNYSNFPLSMISVLCQQRKCKVAIWSTAQRYMMVDKLFRSITTDVIDCKKYWRFCRLVYYDAWEMENAVNYESVKPRGRIWWFVKNQDYNSYDTMALIRKESAADFISNDEAIKNKGLDMIRNNVNVKNVIVKYEDIELWF